MFFVASKTATRIWRVCKEAGRSWPVLDDDDVIDFMIMEAIAVKARKEEEDAEKAAKRRQWRDSKEGRDKLREAAG